MVYESSIDNLLTHFSDLQKPEEGSESCKLFVSFISSSEEVDGTGPTPLLPFFGLVYLPPCFSSNFRDLVQVLPVK